jgi:hypothetical protein
MSPRYICNRFYSRPPAGERKEDAAAEESKFIEDIYNRSFAGRKLYSCLALLITKYITAGERKSC